MTTRCFARLRPLVLAVVFLGACRAQDLPAVLRSPLKAAQIPPHAVGIYVGPLDGNEARLAWNADQAMRPASTMKLVTTAVALDQLGPNWRWKTTAWADGPVHDGVLEGDLYLKGSGDPKLSFERVWLLLRELRAQGIQRIRGRLVLDRSAFQPAPESLMTDAFDDQPERAYNVVPDALMTHYKVVRTTLVSDASTLRVRTEPSLLGVSVESAMTLSDLPCQRWTEGWQSPQIVNEGPRVVVRLRGRFPRQCSANRYIGVLNHPGYTARLVRGLWAELGGSIDGDDGEGVVPASATLLAQSESDDLASQIRDINKYSNNTMTRALYLTLGAESGPATAALPTQVRSELAVRTWLRNHGFDWPEFVIENGAGLSRIERISPAHMAALIRHMAVHRYGPEWLASLPLLGVDGSLREPYAGIAFAGEGRFKTGTLKDVKALAGVLRDPHGRAWVMVVMVNDPRASASQPFFEALMQWVREGGAHSS